MALHRRICFIFVEIIRYFLQKQAKKDGFHIPRVKLGLILDYLLLSEHSYYFSYITPASPAAEPMVD